MTADERAEIFRTMLRTRTAIDRMRQVGGPGVYAIFLEKDASVPGIAPGTDGLIYFAGVESLPEQIADLDFKTGKTGFSTLRQRLGALLKNEMGLKAIPRGNAIKDRDPHFFKFHPGDEGRLTQWMMKSLRIGVAAGSDLPDEEKAFSAQFKPALNTDTWKNPAGAKIEKLVEGCRAEAVKNGSPA